jgi:hypothetical protein
LSNKQTDKPLGPVQRKSEWRTGEPKEHRAACDIIIKHYQEKGFNVFPDLKVWKSQGFTSEGGDKGDFGPRLYYFLDVLAQKRIDKNLTSTYWIEVDGDIHLNPWYASKDRKKEEVVYMILYKLDPNLIRFKVEELVKMKRGQEPTYTTFEQIDREIRMRRRGFYIART